MGPVSLMCCMNMYNSSGSFKISVNDGLKQFCVMCECIAGSVTQDCNIGTLTLSAALDKEVSR